MYAVIESGGKQYKVAIGDRLKVESLKLDPGASIDLDKVLLLADGDEVTAGTPYLSKKVEATVVGHGRGEKVRIFKLRRRKNSRNQAGHRQNYTELEIVSIDGKKAEPKPKPAAEAKPAPAEPEAGSSEPPVDEPVVAEATHDSPQSEPGQEAAADDAAPVEEHAADTEEKPKA